MDRLFIMLILALLSQAPADYAALKVLAFKNLPMPLGTEPQTLMIGSLAVFVVVGCFIIAQLCRLMQQSRTSHA